MNRRGFLGAILAAGIAPAIVKASNIMPVFVRARSGGLLVPEQFVITSIIEWGNVLLAPSMIAKNSLKIFENNLKFSMRVGGGYSDSYRVGDVITFSKP